jgi:hypothetical protein
LPGGQLKAIVEIVLEELENALVARLHPLDPGGLQLAEVLYQVVLGDAALYVYDTA